MSQELDSHFVTGPKNNLFELHISWSMSHYSLLIQVMKSKKRSWFLPPNYYYGKRSVINPFISKINFSNNEEFPKTKIAQGYQARPELSEN